MTKSFQIKRCVTDAAFPRFNDGSTVSDGKLKLVYNIYSSTGPSTVPEENQLNLMFLHGNGFSKECWEYMIQQAYDEFGEKLGVCVALDFYNHNESYQLNKEELGYVMAWADGGHDLIKVGRELRLKGPTILIGHSMGAVASLFAAHYDTRMFDSVVAIDPVCYSPVDHDENVGEEVYKHAADHFAKLQKMRDQFKDEADFSHYIDKRSMYRKFHPAIRDRFKQTNMIKHADGTVSLTTPTLQQMMCYYASRYGTAEIEHVLRALDKEVLHVAGDPENFIPPGSHAWIRDRLKHCQVASIPGGSHTVPFEEPDKTWRYVKPFLVHRLDRALQRRKAIQQRRNMSRVERQKWVEENYVKLRDTYPRHEVVSKL